MKSAWRAFKMKSNTKSFGECLKSAWRLEKMSVSMNMSISKSLERSKAVKFTPNKGVESSYNRLDIPESAFYSNSTHRGGRFVND